MKLIRHRLFFFIVTISMSLNSHKALAEVLPNRLPALNAAYSGKLNYIDYGSGKPVSIPLEIQFLTSKNGKNLIVDRVYTDPGFQVFSLSVMRYEKKSKAWIDENFESNGKSTSTYNILEFSVSGNNHWKVVRNIVQQDDKRDALLTITDTFVDDEFRSETRVDYLDTDENENFRRNWIELKVQP
ncbi:MAG: hypothetical protein AAGJ37_18145 [Pseudomonadota bacterium]